MPDANLTHTLLTQFVSDERAEAIQGDLLEECGKGSFRFKVNVAQTLLALFIHHLRQTPTPIFILCIVCILILKVLEMIGLFFMLFVLELNTATLGVMLGSFSVAPVASYLAAVICLRWLPGFGKPQAAITAFLLLVYALVNTILIMTLGRHGMQSIAGSAGNMMMFETLFHIFPIILAGYRHRDVVKTGESGMTGKGSG